MNRIGEYNGQLLNHVEANYRPGDRQLAIELLSALGLHIEDYGAEPGSNKMLGIQFEPDDRDATNNVAFLHQMSETQAAFDAKLKARLAEDADLAEAHARFLDTVEKYPGATPHFGIRYRSMEALDRVIESLESASQDLKARLKVNEMPPYPPVYGMPSIRQVFVQSDVITTAPAGFGQTIELQVERPAA